jgi:hypothetical protein
MPLWGGIVRTKQEAAAFGRLTKMAPGFAGLTILIGLCVDGWAFADGPRVEANYNISRFEMAQSSPQQSGPDDKKPVAKCEARLAEFLSKFDEVAAGARSVDPIRSLFAQYFPLKACDLNEVERLSKLSSYFIGVQQNPRAIAFEFDTRKHSRHEGIYVQLRFAKPSGDSRDPFVKIKI